MTAQAPDRTAAAVVDAQPFGGTAHAAPRLLRPDALALLLPAAAVDVPLWAGVAPAVPLLLMAGAAGPARAVGTGPTVLIPFDAGSHQWSASQACHQVRLRLPVGASLTMALTSVRFSLLTTGGERKSSSIRWRSTWVGPAGSCPAPATRMSRCWC